MDAWMDERANCQLHLHDRAMYTDANIHRNHVLVCLPFARLVKEGYKEGYRAICRIVVREASPSSHASHDVSRAQNSLCLIFKVLKCEIS